MGFAADTISDYLSKKAEATQESIKEEKAEENQEPTQLEDSNAPLINALQQKLNQLAIDLAKEKEAAPKGFLANFYTDKTPEWREREEEIKAGKSFINVFNENKRTVDNLLIEKIDGSKRVDKLTKKIQKLTDIISQNNPTNSIKGFSNHVTLLKEKIVSYIPKRAE